MTASSQSLSDLILSHFDAFQKSGYIESETDSTHGSKSKQIRKRNVSSKSTTEAIEVETASTILVQDLTTKIITDAFSDTMSLQDKRANCTDSDDEDQSDECQQQSSFMERAKQEVAETILHAVESALATLVSSGNKLTNSFKNASFYQSVTCIMQIASIVTCKKGDGYLASLVLERVGEFGNVDMESVRFLVCEFFGLCLKYLQSYEYVGARGESSNVRKQMQKRNRMDGAIPFLSGIGTEEEEIQWRMECSALVKAILLPRLADKSHAVRNAALASCRYFYSSQEEASDNEIGVLRVVNKEDENEVLQAMLFNLVHDSSYTNRSMAMSSLPVTEKTIPFILERVRDTKIKVRTDALDILRTKVDISKLSDEERAGVLAAGLTDRCSATYAATAKMLCCGWMKSMKFDAIAMLRLLRPSANEAVCEKAARAIIGAASEEECINNEFATSSTVTLKDLSDNEVRAYKEEVLKPISIVQNNECDDPLDPATVLFIRVMCKLTMESKTLTEVQRSDKLSKLIPDIPVLGEILEEHIIKLKDCTENTEEDESLESSVNAEKLEEAECFICSQLLTLARNADLTEEGSRRHFCSIVHSILCSIDTHDDLVEDCVKALAAAHDAEAHFLQSISEIVAEVNDTEAAEESTRRAEDLESRHIRSIEIISVVLENISPRMSSNATLKNFSNHILPAIANTGLGSLVREAGISCLGKYAILMSEDTVIDNFKGLLVEVALSEEEKMEIRAQALLALCDLAFIFERMFAPITLKSSSDSEVSLTDVLLNMLIQSKTALVVVAAECAAKLLFSGRIHDANIVAHLVMIFFDKQFSNCNNEALSEDVKEVGSPIRLQQLLTLFFPAYSIRSQIGRDTLLASVKPVLELIDAKMSIKIKGKKAYAWPVAKIAEYICSIVERGEENDTNNKGDDTLGLEEEKNISVPSNHKETSPALSLAVSISIYLIEESSNIPTAYLRSLCRILGGAYIDIKFEDPSATKLLKNNMDELSMLVTDNVALRMLETLNETLGDFSDDSIGDDKSEDGAEDVSSDIKDDVINEKLDEENKDSSLTQEGRHLNKKGRKSNESRDSIDSNTSILKAIQRTTLEDSKDNKISTKCSESKKSAKNKVLKKKVQSVFDSDDDDIPTFATLGATSRGRNSSSRRRSASRLSLEESDDFIPPFASVSVSETGNRQQRATSRRNRVIESDESETESTSENDADSEDSLFGELDENSIVMNSPKSKQGVATKRKERTPISKGRTPRRIKR